MNNKNRTNRKIHPPTAAVVAYDGKNQTMEMPKREKVNEQADNMTTSALKPGRPPGNPAFPIFP